MIQWKENYRLGIDIIDEQHKKLFDIAEEAEYIMCLPDYLDKFDGLIVLLNELRDYVKYHFEYEQQLLLDIQYSKYFSHKVEHDDFIKYVMSLDMDDIDKHQNDRGRKILNKLIEWLIEHVLKEDKEWSKIYLEKQNYKLI